MARGRRAGVGQRWVKAGEGTLGPSVMGLKINFEKKEKPQTTNKKTEKIYNKTLEQKSIIRNQ